MTHRRPASTPLKRLAGEADSADVWRTLTQCPLCYGLVHLTPTGTKRTRPNSPAPHARIQLHYAYGRPCEMSHRTAPAWDEPTTRAAVHGRSMEVCEFCQRRRATDMHHRVSRGVGGKWHPANIIHLCRECHHKATVYRDWAYLVGLVVLSHEDPAAKAVERPSDLLWLTDEVTGGLDDEHRQQRPRAKRRHARMPRRLR